MRQEYRWKITLLSLFFCSCALNNTIKLKEVNESYQYKETSSLLSIYPTLYSKAEYSTDYKKALSILYQKPALSQQHFTALQALKESYAINLEKSTHSLDGKYKEFCGKLYSEIRRVFLDTMYDYRLRLKSLEYMGSINKKGFPDREIEEAVEIMATTFGDDKKTQNARKRAILFIKKHNIM